jgi:hypothetical protein
LPEPRSLPPNPIARAQTTKQAAAVERRIVGDPPLGFKVYRAYLAMGHPAHPAEPGPSLLRLPRYLVHFSDGGAGEGVEMEIPTARGIFDELVSRC